MTVPIGGRVIVRVAAGAWSVKGPRYTLASFRSLGRNGGRCPRSVFLVKRRVEWQEVGALVDETAELIEVGCRGRRCVVCGSGWKRYHLARMFSGTVEVDMGRLVCWTITAPGWVDNAESWNASILGRWKLVWRALRRLLPEAVEYYGVKEFQARGLIHLHVLIRLSAGVRLPKSVLGRGNALERLLLTHGFGEWNRWRPVYGSVGSACGYLGKYLVKSAHETDLAKGSHVDFWSRGWSLRWIQAGTIGEIMVYRKGAWQFSEKWEYGGRTVGEALEKGEVIALTG